MGRKLTVEEINQRTIDFPNEGFDTCSCCDGVEPQGEMLEMDNDSFDLICEECDDHDNVSIDKIKADLDEAVDKIFFTAHQLFKTQSGDITPVEVSRLDALKRQMVDLIITQTKRNV